MQNVDSTDDGSPFDWDGKTQYSEPYKPTVRHQMRCMWYDRLVVPADTGWRQAVLTRHCGYRQCGGPLIVEDARDEEGARESGANPAKPIKTHTRYLQPVPTGRKA